MQTAARPHTTSVSTGLTVGDVTRTQLYTLPSSATIKMAAAELIRRDIDCVIVEEDDGAKHVLTEMALLKALLPSSDELYERERLPDELELEEIAADHADRPLSDIDLPMVPTVPQNFPAMKALAQMLAHNKRRMLVSDSDGEIVGLVTQRDLLRSVLFKLHTSYYR